MNALFKIGYGLYVVTSNDGKQNNGLIVNTVTQVSDNPNRIAVNINKANYSYHVIKQTGILNVNCLTVDAPFKVFENFGFQSGRNTDKFVNYPYILSDNGLPILTNYINASISLKVENYIDLDSHGMFICSVTEARVMNNKETMTYEYYQKNVNLIQMAKKDLFVKYVAMFMKVMSYLMIIYVHYVNMVLRILNQ